MCLTYARAPRRHHRGVKATHGVREPDVEPRPDVVAWQERRRGEAPRRAPRARHLRQAEHRAPVPLAMREQECASVLKRCANITAFEAAFAKLRSLLGAQLAFCAPWGRTSGPGGGAAATSRGGSSTVASKSRSTDAARRIAARLRASRTWCATVLVGAMRER